MCVHVCLSRVESLFGLVRTIQKRQAWDETALDTASFHGHAGVVKDLIEHGATVDRQVWAST